MKYNNPKIDKFMDWLENEDNSFSLPSARIYKIFQKITGAGDLDEEEEKFLNLITQETILHKAAMGEIKESTAKMILENDFDWSEKSEQKSVDTAIDKLVYMFKRPGEKEKN